WRPSLPEVVATHYWGSDFSRVSHGLDREPFDTDAHLQATLAGTPHLSYVSLVGGLCNQDGCVAVVPESSAADLIAFDFGHLTLKGSLFVAHGQLRSYLLTAE
ncbi:MAG: acyltransferase family protein, partial [Vicinamibacterales bacterium]